MNYVASIGLEIHVQLRTRSKMFCACPTQFGAPPNTLVCPVCLGYPGALPVINAEAIRLTVQTGMMLGAEIPSFSRFDRKNYFYPDAPKNYQISQLDFPLCRGGALEIATDAGTKTIRLSRIHLEEDVGKNMHFERSSGVDFNRAGMALMEVVTEPNLASADEALAFLLALKQILVYGRISECNLEQGNLRCDVNCSIRPSSVAVLGVKTEMKNLNTFKGVHRALDHEIARQIGLLDAGETVKQETRRWDDEAGTSFGLRSKELVHDYRYFPDPDLMPITLAPETTALWREGLPELPAVRRARFEREYGVPAYDAGVLVADPIVADFYERAARHSGNFKAVSNWVMTDVLRVLSEKDLDLADCPLTPEALAELIKLIDSKTINITAAKEVFAVLVEQGGDPAELVREKGLGQVSDATALETLVDQALAEHPQSVASFKSGKAAALQHLVGQVMKSSRGKANPQMVRDILRHKLSQ